MNQNKSSALSTSVKELGKWYHKIDLGLGVTTPGDRNQALAYALFSEYLPENLEEKTVLDLGTNACGLSLEFAKRGAKVVAVESSPFYCKQAKFVVEHFGLIDNIQIVNADVFDILELGSFDFVCYVGLAYHIRHPQLVFDMLSHMTKERIFFSTQVMPGNALALRSRAQSFRPSDAPLGSLYNYKGTPYGYEATELIFLEMCAASGFRQVEVISRKPHPGESDGNYLGNSLYCTAIAATEPTRLPSLRRPPNFRRII